MIKTSQALAPNEQFRLQQCEQTIERGLQTFVDVGRALTEIRDSKLYRFGHKTFETYCKGRWEIDRSRAYQLIGQANVASAIKDAAGNLSNAFDISKRDADAVKSDLPAVTAEIKSRIEQGEAPEAAAKGAVKSARVKAEASKGVQQAEFDRQRDEARASLSPEVQAAQAAKSDAVGKRKDDGLLAASDRVAELEEEVRVLEAENASFRVQIAKFGDMRVEFEKGGFEEVIRGKDAVINAQASRIERESQEKVANLRSMEFWKKKAIESGYSRDMVIDLDTGEALNG